MAGDKAEAAEEEAALTRARRSRGQAARRADEQLVKLEQQVVQARTAEANGTLNDHGISQVTGKVTKARESVAKFRDAVELFEQLEGMTDEEAEADEYTELLYQAETRLEDAEADSLVYAMG